ncbi:hypothetical protein COO60DRAFT_1527207 [Scenedesmus sp. NREL 46B-D3]|nr:hypothetical protein COO60DRAFT_1527207 [Scenedesmus sp. NREL 46B-D3]
MAARLMIGTAMFARLNVQHSVVFYLLFVRLLILLKLRQSCSCRLPSMADQDSCAASQRCCGRLDRHAVQCAGCP